MNDIFLGVFLLFFSAGSGTTVYDGYNDFVEEDHRPQLDYKGVYGKTNSGRCDSIYHQTVCSTALYYTITIYTVVALVSKYKRLCNNASVCFYVENI